MSRREYKSRREVLVFEDGSRAITSGGDWIVLAGVHTDYTQADRYRDAIKSGRADEARRLARAHALEHTIKFDDLPNVSARTTRWG